LPGGRKSFDLLGTISVAYSGFRDLVLLVDSGIPVDDENIARVLARTREAVIAAGVLGGRSRRQLKENFATVADEEVRAAAAFSVDDVSAIPPNGERS
jgi:hypothetical protein